MLEFSDTRVCPLSIQQSQLVKDWVEACRKDALESEAYARDINETEQYLTVESRKW